MRKSVWTIEPKLNMELTEEGLIHVWQAILYASAFTLSVLAAILLWHKVDQPSPVKFVLDMTVTGVTQGAYGVDLYVNNVVEQPFRTAVHSGRFRYEWPCNVASVTFLRLDPVGTRNSETAIHSFSIESNGVVLKRFDASELANWDRVEPGEVVDGEFRLKSGEEINHIQTSNVNLRMPQPPGLNRLLRAVPVDWTQRLLGILLFLGLLAAAVGGRFNMVLLVLIATGLFLGFAWTKTTKGGPPMPSAAVGLSTYGGYQTRVIYDLLVLGVVPSIAALAVWRLDLIWPCISQKPHDRSSTPAAVIKDPGIGFEGVPGFIAAAVVSAVVLMYYTWGAEYAAKVIPKQPILPGWDLANNELWAYLYNLGALPFRDFWYPYGGYIATQAPFPWGFLFERLYLSLCLILCFFGFYFITGKSRERTLLLFTVWFALSHEIPAFNWVRYTVLVPFTLAYVAVSRKKRLGAEHIVFWLSVLLALLSDLAVFVYAWLAVVGVLVADILQDRRSFLKELRPRIVREFAVPGALILFFCLRIVVRGQLHGYVEFFSGLGALSAYSSVPATEDSWLRFVSLDSGFFLWAGALLLGLGLYSCLTDGPREKPKSLAILLLGLLNLVLFYKFLVRPGEVIFFGLPVPVAGFLLLIFGPNQRSDRLHKMITVAAAGLLLGTIYETGAWPTFWTRVGHPSVAWNDAKSIIHLAGHSDEYVARRWDLNNFQLDQPLLAVMNEIRPQLSGQKCCDLFTLSDEQILYMMARKRPPYYSNLYNESPLTAQKRTIAWLDENRPSVVVYATTYNDVFGVPGVVRDPLVFERIIRGYVLEKRVGDYAILRPRGPSEPVDLDFWGDLLGDIQLLSLPRYSAFARFDACGGKDCVDFLKVRTMRQADQAVIGIAVAGRRFQVHMSLLPEQREYFIYLDRLWFWGGLKRAGLTPVVSDHSPGIDVEVISRANREDILY